MNPQELQKTQATSLVILATIAVVYCLYEFRSIFIPLVFSVLILIPLYPTAQWVNRKLKIMYPLAVVVVLLLLMLGFFVFGKVAYLSFNGLSKNISVYQEGLNQLNEKLEKQSFYAHFRDTQGNPSSPEKSASPLPTKAFENALLKISNFMLNFFSNFLLIFIFLLFLMLGVKERKKGDNYIGDIVEDTIKNYIVVKTTISFITGFLTFLILKFFHVDFALAFGLLAFLLNFIPSIGSIFAVILPTPVIFLSPQVSLAQGLVTLTLLILIQFSIGNIIEPKIMGNKLKLHPVVILIALLFWGGMWGIPGMFLAVPLTVVLKINAEHRRFMNPLAPILEGNLDCLKIEPKSQKSG